MVEAHGVHKYFGHHHVLRGVDLQVRKGEVVVIVGPSGSGKSTFLRTINHLDAPDKGWVRIDGEMLGYRRGSTSPIAVSDTTLSEQRQRIARTSTCPLPDHAAQRHAKHQADGNASGQHQGRRTDDQSQNAGTRCAQGHSQTNLLRALRN